MRIRWFAAGLELRPWWAPLATGLGVVAAGGCANTSERVETSIVEARRAGAPLPLAHVLDEALTTESAVQIQRHLVRSIYPGVPAGFKGGLTSPAAQARFRTKGPVAGVLPPSSLQPTGSTLSLSQFPGLVIETEVAFKLGKPITNRVATVEELKLHIAGIAAAVELPQFHFTDPSQVTAIDLVAANLGAAAFVLGTFEPASRRDPNSATTRLLCNERELNVGTARDALGDQWQAALSLVNLIIDAGWTLERDQILLTGALGRAVTALPGQCTADFGDWGSLTFTIAP